MIKHWNQFVDHEGSKAMIDLLQVQAVIRADTGQATLVFHGGAVVTVKVPYEQILGAISDGAVPAEEVYRDNKGKRISNG